MIDTQPNREHAIALPRNFQRLAILYLGISLLVFAATLYVVWTRAVVTVRTSQQEVTRELTLQISETAAGTIRGDEITVPGIVGLIDSEATARVAASGQAALDPSAIGEVTLINESTKDQTLVEKTRLAAPDKPDVVLVRLKKTVTVPAGGSVTAAVYPDVPEQFTSIEPMRFVIPGLATAQQGVIYARNEKTLAAGGSTVAVVTEEDQVSLAEKLKQEAAQKALDQFIQTLSAEQAAWPRLLTIGESPIEFSAAVGETATELSGTIKLKAVVAAFDESQFVTLLRQKFRDELPGKQLVVLSAKDFKYTLSGYDPEQKIVRVKTEVVGKAQAGAGDLSISAGELTGQTATEIKEKLGKLPGVHSVEVEFHPSWLRKSPRFPGKIDIRINPE